MRRLPLWLISAMAFLAFGVTSASAADRSERKIDKLIQTANKQFDRQKYPQAIATFEKATVLSNGTSFESLLGLTKALRQNGEFVRSVGSAGQTVDIAASDEEITRAHNQLGLSLYARARFGFGDRSLPIETPEERNQILSGAARAFQKALETSGGRAFTARFNRAEILYRLRRYDEAQEELLEYLEYEPNPSSDVKRLFDFLEANAELPHRQSLVDAESAQQLFPASGDGISRPVKISSPAPTYSEIARLSRIQGLVILSVVIDTQGRIADIFPVKILPLGLDWQAMDGLRSWRFEPATQDGKPVAIVYNLTVSFALE